MTRRFRAVLPLLLVLATGCAGAPPGPFVPTTSSGIPERLPVTVLRPEGPGPFPAVVIVHDCSGLGPASSGAPGRWGRELVGRGYVVIIPDSFAPRGYPGGVCTAPLSRRRIDVSPEHRADDARAALAWARTLPEVDGRRVGIMGGSHGGSTTLAAMRAPEGGAGSTAGESPAGFAAGVALYPRCVPGPVPYRPVAPLLILIGEQDDWTPAAPCRELAEAARQAGHAVAIKVYPGAHHSFDSSHPVRYVAARINPNAPGGRGATTGGNPQAWADSIREVTAFFHRYLGAR